MKFLFTGGGTGGHLYPALAIARELARDPDNELLYVGIRGRAEERILGGDRRDPRIPLVFARSAGFPGLSPRHLPGFLLTLGFGVLQAAGHLLRFRPDLFSPPGATPARPRSSPPGGCGVWACSRRVSSSRNRTPSPGS